MSDSIRHNSSATVPSDNQDYLELLKPPCPVVQFSISFTSHHRCQHIIQKYVITSGGGGVASKCEALSSNPHATKTKKKYIITSA
jgi:hypothetical protein